ncbi:MAG TPA: hypothetical protein VM597_21740, partial [Gemmataceae bacterium]|nr:hypothetical protein [Gemmataceae bacterium]
LLLSQLYTVTGSSVGRWLQLGFLGPFFFAVGYDAVETLNLHAGGGGRDILVGGVGGDWLDGGADDDLLFDGTTAYDGDPAALLAIRSVWVDPLLSYEDRVKDLRKDYFKGNAVASDGDADQLLGQGSFDWFWANLAFDLLDRDPLTEELG